MKTQRCLSILNLLIPILISACGADASISTPAPVPSQTTMPPSNTSAPAPTETASLSSTPDLVEACKLNSYSFTNVGFGLPNPPHKLPSLGTVKTAILFADFSDVPASQTPEEIFRMISPNAEKFFYDISYGRMTWVLVPHLVWLRLSGPSEHYGEAIRTYEGHLAFIQEAVDLADADVDFSPYDSVVVMVPPQASKIGYGPAFGADPGGGYTADGKTFANGVTSGADLTAWGFLWLNHETGHTMGLPDLYAYEYDTSNYNDVHRFVGGFGLMGWIDGAAPEYFAFERWQLGWLDDSQIICQTQGQQSINITAIETNGGTKAVMVPLSESKLVVVESRRAIRYDRELTKPGVLVYTVDTAVFSGEGTLVVYPILDGDPYRYQSPLAVGESVTVEGVTVTVIGATNQEDTVQVTIE